MPGATTCGSKSALRANPNRTAIATWKPTLNPTKTKTPTSPPRASPPRCWPGCPYHGAGLSWITSAAFIKKVITNPRPILREQGVERRVLRHRIDLPLRDRRAAELRGGHLLARPPGRALGGSGQWHGGRGGSVLPDLRRREPRRASGSQNRLCSGRCRRGY